MASETEAEIANLQKVRATLEIVRESTEKMYNDIKTATENQRNIQSEFGKTVEVLKKV